MWFQILPSLFITGGLIYIPSLVVFASSYWYTGSVHGRDRDTDLTKFEIFRDARITGKNPYRQHKFLGLDGIPDD